MLLYCRFPGLHQRLFGTNNSNAYYPLPTDEMLAADNVQQSNNADVDANANQSSAVVSPTVPRRRRHGLRSPTRQVPTLKTIPEEHGEDGAEVTDDSNANTNNSSLLPVTVNSKANNSAGNSSLVRLQDARYTTPSLTPPPPPPARGGNGVGRAWTRVLPGSLNYRDDDGFETVDLFAA